MELMWFGKAADFWFYITFKHLILSEMMRFMYWNLVFIF